VATAPRRNPAARVGEQQLTSPFAQTLARCSAAQHIGEIAEGERSLDHARIADLKSGPRKQVKFNEMFVWNPCTGLVVIPLAQYDEQELSTNPIEMRSGSQEA